MEETLKEDILKLRDDIEDIVFININIHLEPYLQKIYEDYVSIVERLIDK